MIAAYRSILRAMATTATTDNAHETIKIADGVLNQWADVHRVGFSVDLGTNITSIYREGSGVGLSLEENLIDEVDIIVGAMQFEIHESIIRYYLDPIPGKKYVYFKKDYRTIKMKAETEKISADQLNINLRIGRNIVYHQLNVKGLI